MSEGEGGGEPATEGSLKTRTVRSLGVVLLFRLLTVVYQVFKARLLDPAAVGIVSIGETLVGLGQTAADAGIERAAIQVTGEDRAVVNTAFLLRLALAVPCFAALCLFAPIWGAWQGGGHAADVVWVVRLLAFNLVIGVPSIVPSTQLTRHLQFGRNEAAQFAAIVMSSLLGMGLLYWARLGYRAVAIAAVANVGCYTLLVCAMNRGHFHAAFGRATARRLLGFGKYAMANGVLIYLINNVDNAILSPIRGLAELGVYQVAWTWGNAIVLNFTQVASKVMFPTLARLQSEPERFRSAYLHNLRFGAFVVCPIGLGLAAVAPQFVPRVLGPAWDPAVTRILPLWCVYGCLRSFASVHGSALDASGHPRLITLTSLLFLLLVVPSGILAAQAWGALGLTCAFLCVSFLANLLAIGLVRKAIGVRIGEVAGWILRPLLSATLMAAAVAAVTRLFPGRGWAHLLVPVFAGVWLYLGASSVLQRSTLVEAWRLLLRGLLPSVDASHRG